MKNIVENKNSITNLASCVLFEIVKKSSLFQLRLQAVDTFYPTNPGFSTVTINVIRNPNPPDFVLPSYQVTVNEYFPLGDVVIDLDAVDADSVSPVKFAELCLYSQAIVKKLLCLLACSFGPTVSLQGLEEQFQCVRLGIFHF